MGSLATNVRQFAPGVRLAASPHRFSHQLYADDLVVVADCEHDLQVICDVGAEWARKWRFTFGVGPTKSAVMVFGPGKTTVGCSVTLGGVPLPQVAEYPYLGVTLTTSLSWGPHIRKLISRGHRLFAQCVSWCSSERLPFQFASHLFLTYVLPSVSWGCEFCFGSSPAIRLLDGVLRRWCRCLLGWRRRSPNAAVHVEVGWPDTQRFVTNRLLSLRAPQLLAHGRLFSLPALVFHVMSVSPNSLSAVCNALCVSLQITTPTRFGVDPGCSARRVREWFAQCVVPPLDRTLHDRLCSAAASFAIHHVDLGSQQVNCRPTCAHTLEEDVPMS